MTVKKVVKEDLNMKGSKFSLYAGDVLPSIVVFLVALPLCMGIAIASGVDPAAGLITGIVGGLLVGPLSGCPLQISGPAAGLAVITAQLITEHGIERLGIIIVVAGLVQLMAGLSRLAQWFRAVPPSVIHGMLSGIGVLIFAGQFHVMVDDLPKESGFINLISIPSAVWKGLSFSLELPHFAACMIGLLTISLLLIWNRMKSKFDIAVFNVLPGSLFAIVVATAVAWLYHLDIKFVSLPDNFAESFRFIHYSQIKGFISWELLLDGIAMAFIAAAETLLTATAVDKMHKGERTNYDRELMAQGVGNVVCGLVGGLAMTGVMVRSGVNVAAGGKTRASAFLHGLWLLLFFAFLPFIVELIPRAALAALLVYTGWKLANFKIMRELEKYGKSEVYIYLATVGAIVCFDLLTGVLIGIALSVGKLLYIFSHLEIKVAEDMASNRTDVFLKGAATFLSLPRFAEALERVRPDTELHVHLDALDYIDHACLDMVMSWEEKHVAGGGHLVIDWGTMEAASGRPGRSRMGSSTMEFREPGKSSASVRTRPLPLEESSATEVKQEE